MVKKLLIISVLIAFLGIGFFFLRGRSKPLEYTQVTRQNISSTISASGVLTGKKTANLRFKTSGKLAALNVEVGDQIKAYQALAYLNTTELNILLAQAQNNLRDRQAALDKIIDDIHLFQYGNGGFGNVGSINETATQKANRTAAEVARDNAYDAVRISEKALQDALLVSPFAGLITKVDTTPGQTVSQTDLIAQIVDITDLYFDAEVDESDISKIILGQKANVILNSYPDKEFEGLVDQIKPVTKTASSGATVVVVRIKLEDPNIVFIADLNGQAEIKLEEAKDVLTIPQDALVEDQFVYIEEDGKVRKVEVKTGLVGELEVEIKEGLRENQKVIRNPQK